MKYNRNLSVLEVVEISPHMKCATNLVLCLRIHINWYLKLFLNYIVITDETRANYLNFLIIKKMLYWSFFVKEKVLIICRTDETF